MATSILFIHCDSMDGRVMGCMGHPAMARATPNLDRLAQRGVLFRNAYTNNPICCPSRASMWSGQFTHHCEGWNNYKGLAETDPTFRTYLDEAGYAVVNFGKTDYLSGAHTVRARVSPWTRAANIHRPSYRMHPPEIVLDQGARVRSGDWGRVDEALDWLRQNVGDGNPPFLLNVGLGLPHPPFRTSQRYLDMIDEAGVGIPPLDEDDHPVLAYQRCVKNWMHGFEDETIKTIRRIYFAMIAELDAMVGHLLEGLDELGLTSSTVVIFSSDHGELALEHRQFYKMSHYEASARIPLMATGPGVRQGAIVDDLVSLVDIYPTFMDLAGIETPAGLDGYSLTPELSGQPGVRPDWVLSEFHGTTCSTGAFMLRQADWKYIAYVGHEPQLFDLASDPDEVRNLAATRLEAVERMDRLLRSIVDYDEVDARAKAYDRRSFGAWREAELAAGTYEDTMARVYSGWDRLPDDEVQPWTADDEAQIKQWLGEA